MHNIVTSIKAICRKYPGRTAIGDDRNQMSYRELLGQVKKVAGALEPLHCRRKPVLIYMDREPSCIVAMLGVVFSGNFYVVADTGMSEGQTIKILESLFPVAIITDSRLYSNAEQLAKGIPILIYEQMLQVRPNQAALDQISKEMVDTDPVYTLYSSGPTGFTEGVLVSQKALLSYTQWFIDTFEINQKTVFGSQTPLYCSMSVTDLYGALLTGARYQIIPKSMFSFPTKLMDYLNSNQINTIYWVPSVLSIVAHWDGLSYVRPPYLKKLLFAGEVMPVKALNYWRKHYPEAICANLYGKKETTDICCYYMIDREISDDESLPIGRPCENCGILIVDENGNEAECGELLVRGSFLANGYYNNAEKTAETFIQNPLNRSYPEIVCRTGDRGIIDEKGELRYLGRKEDQIKHMGYQIELREIEAAAGIVDRIRACICLYDHHRENILLIYEGSLKESDLTEQLRTCLPSYMQPGTFIRLRQMPYNSSGKIDRATLAAKYIVSSEGQPGE